MAARGGLWLGGYLGPTTYLGPPVPLGGASDTSSAHPMRRAKRRTPGQAVEADLARAITRRKLRGIDQPGEHATAQRVTPVKRRRLGPGLERQRARPLRLRDPLGRAAEHDTARPMEPVKVRRIGQAVELSTVCTFHLAGYGVSPYGVGPYGDPLGGGRLKRRRVGPGRDRQRARPITPA